MSVSKVGNASHVFAGSLALDAEKRALLDHLSLLSNRLGVKEKSSLTQKYLLSQPGKIFLFKEQEDLMVLSKVNDNGSIDSYSLDLSKCEAVHLKSGTSYLLRNRTDWSFFLTNAGIEETNISQFPSEKEIKLGEFSSLILSQFFKDESRHRYTNDYPFHLSKSFGGDFSGLYLPGQRLVVLKVPKDSQPWMNRIKLVGDGTYKKVIAVYAKYLDQDEVEDWVFARFLKVHSANPIEQQRIHERREKLYQCSKIFADKPGLLPGIFCSYANAKTGEQRIGSLMPQAEGDVSVLIRNQSCADAIKLKIALDSAKALQIMHHEGWIHHDLKPENLLIKNGQTYICDFDFAAAYKPTEKVRNCGCPDTAAPELFLYNLYGPDAAKRTDVYSLGVTFWMLAMDSGRAIWNIPKEFHAKYQITTQPARPKKEEYFGDFFDLVFDMIEWDPMKRPTIGQVVQRLTKIGKEAGLPSA